MASVIHSQHNFQWSTLLVSVTLTSTRCVLNSYAYICKQRHPIETKTRKGNAKYFRDLRPSSRITSFPGSVYLVDLYCTQKFATIFLIVTFYLLSFSSSFLLPEYLSELASSIVYASLLLSLFPNSSRISSRSLTNPFSSRTLSKTIDIASA